eukprot:XP_014042413.1 PREDICTED: uncharacterized protein LOC106595571 [Salmo salar]
MEAATVVSLTMAVLLVLHDDRYRTTHPTRTKQREEKERERWAREGKEFWTWEEIMLGKGPWRKDSQVEEVMPAGGRSRRRRSRRPGRHPQEFFLGGLMGWSGRAEEEPRPLLSWGITAKEEAEMWRRDSVEEEVRTVSPVRLHSPVRSVPAPHICRARGSVQRGRVVPAQRSWPPVPLLGPMYPAPRTRTVSPVRLHSPVRFCASAPHLPG